MPRTTFTITGDISDFDRIDNLYKNLKREGNKALTNWEIKVDAFYTESQKKAE